MYPFPSFMNLSWLRTHFHGIGSVVFNLWLCHWSSLRFAGPTPSINMQPRSIAPSFLVLWLGSITCICWASALVSWPALQLLVSLVLNFRELFWGHDAADQDRVPSPGTRSSSSPQVLQLRLVSDTLSCWGLVELYCLAHQLYHVLFRLTVAPARNGLAELLWAQWHGWLLLWLNACVSPTLRPWWWFQEVKVLGKCLGHEGSTFIKRLALFKRSWRECPSASCPVTPFAMRGQHVCPLWRIQPSVNWKQKAAPIRLQIC